MQGPIAQKGIKPGVAGNTALSIADRAVVCQARAVKWCRGVGRLATCTGCARAQRHISLTCSRCPCWSALDFESQSTKVRLLTVNGSLTGLTSGGSAAAAGNQSGWRAQTPASPHTARRLVYHTCSGGWGRVCCSYAGCGAVVETTGRRGGRIVLRHTSSRHTGPNDVSKLSACLRAYLQLSRRAAS